MLVVNKGSLKPESSEGKSSCYMLVHSSDVTCYLHLEFLCVCSVTVGSQIFVCSVTVGVNIFVCVV